MSYTEIPSQKIIEMCNSAISMTRKEYLDDVDQCIDVAMKGTWFGLIKPKDRTVALQNLMNESFSRVDFLKSSCNCSIRSIQKVKRLADANPTGVVLLSTSDAYIIRLSERYDQLNKGEQ